MTDKFIPTGHPDFLGTLCTDLAGWSDTKGCAKQRNTERHAVRMEPLLKRWEPQHAMVHAAQLPDGTLIKLDGHTRCYLWEKGLTPIPDMIFVQIWAAKNKAHATRMYDLYDNAKSTEGNVDKVYGALREHGVEAESKLLQRGGLTSSLSIVVGVQRGLKTPAWGCNINEAVADLVVEIADLDKIVKGHGPKRLPTPIVAAILLTLRRRGYRSVISFWKKYLDLEPNGHVRDPHNLLVAFLEKSQAAKQTSGTSNLFTIVEKAISACENGMRGQQVKFLVGCDAVGYLKKSQAVEVDEEVLEIPEEAPNDGVDAFLNDLDNLFTPGTTSEQRTKRPMNSKVKIKVGGVL